MLEWLIAGVILLIILILLYLLISLQQEVNKQKLSKRYTNHYSTVNPSNTISKNFTVQKMNYLESKLLKMVGGQRDVAQRLVDNIKLKHPDQNENWCWEKAIEDLERDHR